MSARRGTYRILYRIDEENQEVIVLRIGQRGGVRVVLWTRCGRGAFAKVLPSESKRLWSESLVLPKKLLQRGARDRKIDCRKGVFDPFVCRI